MTVAFTRVYEIPDDLIRNSLLSNECEIDQSSLEREAIRIAYDWLSEEMPDFVAHPEDFVSAKIL